MTIILELVKIGFWITNELGTMAKGEEVPEGVHVVDAMSIPDDRANPWDVRWLIEEACGYLRLHGKVFIKCHAGVSRSNAIAIGVLVEFYDMGWNEAYSLVRHKVSRMNPNMDILDSVKSALVIMNPKRVEKYYG